MLHLRDSGAPDSPTSSPGVSVIRLRYVLIRDLDDLVAGGRYNDGFDVTLLRCDQKNQQIALKEYISD
jgi:hypothetical protein